MRCRTAERLMSLQLDHALAPADLARLSQHLEQCARCRATWVAMRRANGLFDNVSWAEAPPELVGRVLTRLPADRQVAVSPASVWVRATQIVMAALVLLLVGVTGVVMFLSLGPDPGEWARLWEGGRSIVAASWAGVQQLVMAFSHIVRALWQGLGWPWVPVFVLVVAIAALAWGWLWRRSGPQGPTCRQP